MRLLVTGGTGLIGRRLVAARLARGDEVVVLSRDAARARERLAALDPAPEIVEGDPMRAGPWQAALSGCDAVVNLAGAGVADRRWTAAYKKLMIDSRVEGTRHVIDGMRDASPRPTVLVNASAVGWYGDCGDTPLREEREPGDDFLATLAVSWEAAAREAERLDVRVAIMRFGVVLDPDGGALGRMLAPFRLGLGGPLGSGRQYLPWVHWHDVVGLVALALESDAVRGPVNVVAPQPVTNREFARTLGAVLRRPAFLPVPRLALRVVMGAVADALTASQRVVPAAAERFGYRFRHETLRGALEAALGET